MPYKSTRIEHLQREPWDVFAVGLNNGDKLVVTHSHVTDEQAFNAKMWEGVAYVLAGWLCDKHDVGAEDSQVQDKIQLAFSEYVTGLRE